MTQEDKQLLLEDLCPRLMYGVICTDFRHGDSRITEIDIIDETVYYNDFDEYVEIKYCRPYLRPMSSMTEEETKYKLSNFFKVIDTKIEGVGYIPTLNFTNALKYINWLNKNHFDYRGLIEKGLALEARKGMYKLNY